MLVGAFARLPMCVLYEIAHNLALRPCCALLIIILCYTVSNRILVLADIIGRVNEGSLILLIVDATKKEHLLYTLYFRCNPPVSCTPRPRPPRARFI